MNITRIVALVLLAVGATLLIFGYTAAQSVSEQTVNKVTGQFSNQTMWYVLGGGAAIVGGAALCIWGGDRARRRLP